MEDRILTVKEAAEYLGYCIGTLDNWRSHEDTIGPRFYKPKGKVIYFKSDLDAWLTDIGKYTL